MKNIIIRDQQSWKQKIKKIKTDGLDKLQVVSDFDGTLTKAFVDGRRVPSIISILRDGNYLTPEYGERAHKLYETYSRIENDPSIPDNIKREKMREWWTRHFELLIRSGLRLRDIHRAVESGIMRLRDGAAEFFAFLRDKKIPLIILSSSGLGADFIPLFLEQHGLLSENIHVVSNRFEWDADGRAIKVKEPIIHGMNKDKTALSGFPFYKTIRNRTNALLLGDSLGDIGMLAGANVTTALMVGFLNEPTPTAQVAFSRIYDMVILGDQSLAPINDLCLNSHVSS